jgi:hypothetical protein
MDGDQPAQLGHDVVEAECEPDVDADLDGPKSLLLEEAADLARERLAVRHATASPRQSDRASPSIDAPRSRSGPVFLPTV